MAQFFILYMITECSSWIKNLYVLFPMEGNQSFPFLDVFPMEEYQFNLYSFMWAG